MMAAPGWPSRRVVPSLAPATIHVWHVAIDAPPTARAAFQELLAPDELQRASRFHFDRDAARYVVCRGVLRRILAAYVGAEAPGDVQLRYGAHGKPSLAGSSRGAGGLLEFNVAHSGGVALLAFGNVDLGVDVECIHAIPDLHALMSSCFASGERSEIVALPPAAQHHAFFRCWTRKEAVLKAMGWGLARPLDSFEVATATDDVRVLCMDGDADAGRRWQVRHLQPVSDVIGALAWVGAPCDVQCYSYDAW